MGSCVSAKPVLGGHKGHQLKGSYENLGGHGGNRKVRRVYVYLQMGMLVVEEEWEREVRGGGGIPVLNEV